MTHVSAPRSAVSARPDDASARGLLDGTVVRVWNDLGEVHLPLRADIADGTCCNDARVEVAALSRARA